MISSCTSRGTALARAVIVVCLAAGALVACGSGDLLVGDDSRDAATTTTTEAGTEPDAPVPTEKDAATSDVQIDAPPGSCAAAPGGPGMCLPNGSACRQADTSGLTCPNSGLFCCIVSCPELAQPVPGFCDGGPYAPIYDAKACIVGFACTPVACTAAGGTCVGLAPGTCATNHIGDAMKYSCGGGLGVACCLP